jgi:peptide/nickel transport system substrate-binding protein
MVELVVFTRYQCLLIQGCDHSLMRLGLCSKNTLRWSLILLKVPRFFKKTVGQKNGRGQWVKDGQPFKLEILGWAIFADIGPVLAEQLKRQGIDAVYTMPPDWGDRFTKGQFQGALFGHGGSVSGDPYFTLHLYQCTTKVIPGAQLSNLSRWCNDKFDQIVDEMAVTPQEDKAKLTDQFKRAMEIWLPELPDIQLVEFYHNIPMNTTYWRGWPTEENPYVNAAFWHLTFPLVLINLEPAQ